MMKRRQPVYTNGEEPLTTEEAETILRSRGYDPDAVGKRMNTVAQQSMRITQLETQNAELLGALEWCASTLNGLHLGSVIDSRKRDEIRKHEAIATEAIRKAKEK